MQKSPFLNVLIRNETFSFTGNAFKKLSYKRVLCRIEVIAKPSTFWLEIYFINLTRKGDPIPSEGIDVSHLFDEDSIVANLLQ